VLGCGVDVTYPPEHDQLKRDIVRQGAVITEFPPGTPPHM
jgi:DNA processing protein